MEYSKVIIEIFINNEVSYPEGYLNHSRTEVSHGMNPHGIEPTFLKLDSWSSEAGFIPFFLNGQIFFLFTNYLETNIQIVNSYPFS